jgi:hypothetical protein
VKNIKDIPVPTLITGMTAVVWLGSFVMRSVNPEFTGGPAVDALMATVVAWWAKTRKTNNGGQDDLISEVLSKNVLPIVSHTPTPPAVDAAPPAAYYPKPAPTPYQPPQSVPPPHSPPASKPKQGGLPWGG